MTNRDASLFAKARSVQERIGRLQEEEPAAEEIAAIKQGNKDFREGRFTILSQRRHELGRRRQWQS